MYRAHNPQSYNTWAFVVLSRVHETDSQVLSPLGNVPLQRYLLLLQIASRLLINTYTTITFDWSWAQHLSVSCCSYREYLEVKLTSTAEFTLSHIFFFFFDQLNFNCRFAIQGADFNLWCGQSEELTFLTLFLLTSFCRQRCTVSLTREKYILTRIEMRFNRIFWRPFLKLVLNFVFLFLRDWVLV